MADPSKQIANLKAHLHHIYAIADAPTPAHRNTILQNATPELIEALATAVRLLHESGVKFDPRHQARARKMMSRYTAKRTKAVQVRGKPGAQSRGGGFWQDVGRAFKKVGRKIGIGLKDAARWTEHKALPVVAHFAEDTGKQLLAEAPKMVAGMAVKAAMA